MLPELANGAETAIGGALGGLHGKVEKGLRIVVERDDGNGRLGGVPTVAGDKREMERLVLGIGENGRQGNLPEVGLKFEKSQAEMLPFGPKTQVHGVAGRAPGERSAIGCAEMNSGPSGRSD